MNAVPRKLCSPTKNRLTRTLPVRPMAEPDEVRPLQVDMDWVEERPAPDPTVPGKEGE